MAAGPASGLALQDRRILILADGRRTLDQLCAMLGNDILPRVERLEREGYLAPTGLRAPQPRAQPATPHPQRPAPAPAPASPPPQASARAAAPPATERRRSLAASKMYLLDMLQLQRSAEAVELSTAIRTAAGPEEQVNALLDGMRHILATSKDSYGERVAQRLASTLPEEALPRLQALLPPGAGMRPQLSIVA